jgi:putative ABC transport system substrate-binding protein
MAIHIGRRELIVALGGAAAWPLAARAQQRTIAPTKVFRIGFLFAGTLSLRPQAQEFWRTLQELGYIEGKNLIVEVREARGEIERLPKLAPEIVDKHPDVIVAVTTPATAAARKATQTIPIVMAIISDPLGSGFTKSLARPELNITGPSLMSNELTGKRVQLLKEMLPELSILGLLWNEKSAQSASIVTLAEQSGSSLCILLRSLPVRTPADIKGALDKAFEEHLRAILVANDPLTFDRRGDIVAFSLAKRTPTLHTFPEEAFDGALAAYGPKLGDEYRRAALYVAKILAGATPADLPVDQHTHFEFVLNMKTAKAIGLTIPDSILVRADQLIE